MKLVDFPALVVSRFQVPGIEPLSEHFESTDPAYLDRLLAQWKRRTLMWSTFPRVFAAACTILIRGNARRQFRRPIVGSTLQNT